jgi:hypothetical protein
LNPAILNSQFVQVALPIVLTIFIAAWMNGRSIDGINKRIDDLRIDLRGDLSSLRSEMNNRFGEVNRRLDRIDETLKTHSEKIAGLDERTSPLGRRG